MKYETERQNVADFMQRLYRQKLTTTSGGNISCRTEDSHILLTPSGLDKANLTAAEIAVLTENGENLSPALPPSIELQMHMAIYAARPDIKAIVHAHPVTATAFCASRKEINCRYIAESYVIVGDPVVVPYAHMGTQKLADNVYKAAAENNACMLLENHGVIAGGETLLQAFNRIEVLEASAKITVLLEQIGDGVTLSQENLNSLIT